MSERDAVTATDTPKPADDARPSVVQLLDRLVAQLSDLVHKEIALAKAELSEKLKASGLGIALFAIAAVLAVSLFPVFVFALIALVHTWFCWWISAIIVFGVFVVAAAALVLIGRRLLSRAKPIKPEKAVAGIKQDVETVREGFDS